MFISGIRSQYWVNPNPFSPNKSNHNYMPTNLASKLHIKEQMMNREDAFAIVNEYVKNPNLVKHMLAVEATMRFYARKYGQDEEKWAVAGLLHDFDWEIHPTMEEHPLAGEPILREHGVPEKIIRAVLSHASHTRIPR